jgi:AraC-like DNA-binding protein
METISAPPSLELRPFIRAYAQRRRFAGESPIIEPCATFLEQLLEFEFSHPLHVNYRERRHIILSEVAIHGAITAPVDVRIPENHESFAVFFEPIGLSQLVGVPVAELTDHVHDAKFVLGSALKSLYEQIAEANSFQQRVRIAEGFFLQRLSYLVWKEPMWLAAKYLLHRRGLADVSDIASRFNLSVRQFERRFLESLGLAPKLWARIVRFQSALDAKVAQPGRTWLDIAHDVGYHDQMHLIHDFKTLAGHTPSGLLAQLGDTRPEAVASLSIRSSEYSPALRTA